MARRRKNTGGAGKKGMRTSAPVIMAALIFAAAGAIYYGLGGLVFAGQFKFGLWAWLGAGLLRGLIGAALGAGFVGLVTLIFGARLGPRFSYPFALSLVAGLGELTSSLVQHFGGPTYAQSFWTIGIVVLIVASLAAEGLSSGISGYGKRSRNWAAAWSLAILVIGTVLFYFNSGSDSFSFWFVIKAMSYAVYGGSLGAVAGAIKSAR